MRPIDVTKRSDDGSLMEYVYLEKKTTHNHLTALRDYPREPVPEETFTHEEEGFTKKTRSALIQRGLLDQITSAYNQSRPALTASTFNQLWISMPTVLVAVPAAELSASCINFLHYCLPSGFYGAGKDNRGKRTSNLSGRHPIRGIPGCLCPHLRHPPFFAECPFFHNPPKLSWLGTGTR